jgi:group II intron reverse transcriptase/maturase/CRISPR-associated endonuclease Cas1
MTSASNLFERLYKFDTLWDAWQSVKTKNTSGGIDQISVKDFALNAKKEIQTLSEEIKSGHYIPQAYKETRIPKDKNSYRTLGLLSVRDKIVQQAVNALLYKIIDKQLSSSCYAYRHEKGAVKAVRRVKHEIASSGNKFMVSCDIKSYFDNINHSQLFGMLKNLVHDEKLLEFIELCIRMGKVKAGIKWKDNTKGVPQGSVISPLLANLYLTPLDNAVINAGFSYIRYADDFVVLTKTQDEAIRSIGIISAEIKNLELELKTSPQIKSLDNGFTFLGIDFFSDRIELGVSKKERIIEKINTTFRVNKTDKAEVLQKMIRGYDAFYGKLFPIANLEFIDQCISENIQKLIFSSDKTQIKQIKQSFDNLQFLTPDYEKKRDTFFNAVPKRTDNTKDSKKTTTDKLIEKRKRQYQKLESQGKELIINTFGSFVGISAGKVLVKIKQEKPLKFFTENLTHVSILSNGVSISSDFLQECANRQIPVSFFTRTGELYASLYSPFSTNNNLWLNQMKASADEKGFIIAKKIVDAKIRNQANLLKYFHKYHKYADAGFAALFDAKLEKLTGMCKKLKKINYNAEKDYRKDIMAVEAQAAIIYWELVQELINDDSDFSGRERKGAKDLVNSMLNYGYAILYARVTEAIMAAKLNPTISFLHVSNSSKPSLAFDLIELFRQQAVDRVVISILQKKEKIVINNGWLDNDSRAKLTQNIYERLHRYELFRGEKRRFSDIIKLQALALAKFINEESESFKPYIAKW